MSKWILRLTGLLVVALVALLFLDSWLNPDVPDYIEHSVDLRGEQQVQPDPASPTQLDAPPLSLTSQEDASTEAADTLSSALEQPAAVSTEGGLEPLPLTLASQEQEPETPMVLSNPDSARPNAWIQAGSFGERANADKRAAVLRAQGWSVDVSPATVDGKSYHRVYVGPLTHDQIGGYLDKLQAMNIAAREVTR